MFFFSLIFLLPLNKLHYYIDPRWHGFETEDCEDDHTPSVGYGRHGIRMPQWLRDGKSFIRNSTEDGRRTEADCKGNVNGKDRKKERYQPW
jgi:hypothetical protein